MKRQRSFNDELCDILKVGTIVGTITHIGMNFDRYFYLNYPEIASSENLRNYAIMVTSFALVGITARVYDTIVGE